MSDAFYLSWRRFWLPYAGISRLGRLAARLAAWRTTPYHGRSFLADLHPRGYIAPGATLAHPDVRLARNVYLGGGVVISRGADGGPVELGDAAHLYGDSFLHTSAGGSIRIGSGTHVQPGCHLSAHLSELAIGTDVEIAPRCAFYTYDHGTTGAGPIRDLPMRSRGGIAVGDGAWLGHGVIVLDGVTIGRGAVVGAGSVVTKSVPELAIAIGSPARVVRSRSDGATNR